MSSAIKRIGSVAARLSLEDSNVKITDSSSNATLIYAGGLAQLKAKAATFTVGAASSAVPADLNISDDPFKVAGVEITGGPGGTGRLTVRLTAPSHTSASGGTPSEKNVDWQVEWTLVERPLEQHPTFASLFTDSAAIADIEKWKNLPPQNIVEKSQFRVPDNVEEPNTWYALTGNTKLFCEKLAKGITAYQVQVPVVRKTEYRVTGPGSNSDTSTCGKRENPPKFDTLAAAWLKTADSWSKTGSSRWEHRQEWSGFDSLDPDLYPSA